MGFYISRVVSYLISFPLMMGEGWDGGDRGGRNYFLAQLGYE
jgi:hypothetical protein